MPRTHPLLTLSYGRATLVDKVTATGTGTQNESMDTPELYDTHRYQYFNVAADRSTEQGINDAPNLVGRSPDELQDIAEKTQ